MSTAYGEPIAPHVVGRLVAVAPPTPARRHCPNTDRPAWLPPRQFHCTQDHHLQRTYGITCDQYWALFELQEGRCGICLGLPKPGRRLVVDHDHDTGVIAGLCHFGCNRRLTSALRRYLRQPPGTQAGLRIAPAKLRVIQERDDAKCRRAAARRAQPKQVEIGQAAEASFAERVRAALEQTTDQGGA